MSDTQTAHETAGQTGSAPDIYIDKVRQAYTATAEQAKRTVADEVSFNNARRDLAESCAHFIMTTLPTSVLDQFRGAAPGGYPDEIREAFDEFNLPLPHMNSINPFLSIWNHFYLNAKVALGNLDKRSKGREYAITQAEADEEIGDSALPDFNGATDQTDNAKNAMASRYGRYILAGIDMQDFGVFKLSNRDMVKRYAEWLRTNGPNSLARVKEPKPTGKGKGAKGGNVSTASQTPAGADDADDKLMRMKAELAKKYGGGGSPDPGKPPAEATAPNAEATASHVDRSVEIDPNASADDQPKEDAKPDDQPKAEGETEIVSGITFPAGKPGEAAWTPGPGISLSTPVTPASIGLSTAEERAKSPQLEIDGKQVVIRHRKVLEKTLQFRNKQVSDMIPAEGLLRYRKDGDTVTIIETMDWAE